VRPPGLLACLLRGADGAWAAGRGGMQTADPSGSGARIGGDSAGRHACVGGGAGNAERVGAGPGSSEAHTDLAQLDYPFGGFWPGREDPGQTR
jgi:hypothetical protein